MDHGRSTDSSIDVSDLTTALARLGLGQYEESLRRNGFEDWESLAAITETDLAALNFKLGHRRKLQRAIQEHKNTSASRAQHKPREPLVSEERPATGENDEPTPPSPQQAARTTRPYRWHPHPDIHSPQKPKTAYVLFGEHVRRDPALASSSFANIAKETGKRWRELSAEERANVWEAPAAERLQEYKEELERYKQTDNYQNYRTYLQEFKQRPQKPDSTIPSDQPASASSTSELTPYFRLTPPQGQDDSESTPKDLYDTEDPGSEGPSKYETDPIKAGMEEVRRISKALGINPQLTRVTAYPLEEMTSKAVEAFVQGTGSLLYLWNHDEASNLVRSVYHPGDDLKPIPRVLATEVFAMSAVGSYCDGEAHSAVYQEKFLQFFLYMLAHPSDMSDLRRMRLFACLAICRFTNNVESARGLMIAALSIGREKLRSQSFLAETAEEETRYWWHVFRSVVFLESWFAFNTQQVSRITYEDLNLYSPCSKAGNAPEVFHEAVGELGQLAAYIALDLKKVTQKPSPAQAGVHFKSLDDWHRKLPPPMQLSRLSLADPLSLNWHTKRSLLQLHILFLGLFIEPYRNFLIDLANFRLSNTSMELDDIETYKSVEEQCVLAARQSARVASLLQADNLVRPHCWVSIYTCFTGCSLLLFRASQKLLELFGEEISQELLYASSHLNVLSLCSYDNDMARKLYTPLQIIFNDIREVVVSPVYRAMREMNIVAKDVALASPSHYAVDGIEEVSKTILDLTRRVMEVLQETISF